MATERGEIKRPEKTEGVIFLMYKNGQILVEDRIKKGSGYFGHSRIPGGEIEEGESALEAVKREIAEELGVTATEIIHLDDFEDVTLNGGYFSFHAFLITGWEGEIVGQEQEKSLIRWIPLSSARDVLKLASSRLVTQLAREQISGAVS